MKKIIALMCAGLFLFGGTFALASTTSVSEPQKKEKTMDKQSGKDNEKKEMKKDDKKKDNKKKDDKKKTTKATTSNKEMKKADNPEQSKK
ncbi:MAG: hypothetical protein IK041_09295 [Bacteroidales bacterium]|nr:hypothetical protein [Bacteroidales bacterium]